MGPGVYWLGLSRATSMPISLISRRHTTTLRISRPPNIYSSSTLGRRPICGWIIITMAWGMHQSNRLFCRRM
ncbi:hypothetical protein BJX64DRAFT_270198, partial [Aspergillus heterothallicus]